MMKLAVRNDPAGRVAEPTLAKLVALLVLLATVLLAATACGEQQAGAGPEMLDRPATVGGDYLGGTATGDTQKGADFARWVLEQDPNRDYYTDVVVRDERNLGVKVQPNITKRELQQLLVSLTEGMARTFPDRDLRVIAFYQSGDKLAEANYSNRDGNVDVTFAQ